MDAAGGLRTFSLPFRARYEECGPEGDLRASVLARYFQELAFGHSAALGFPLTWYEAHRLFWLLRRIRLDARAPARYGKPLIATTQVIGWRRMLARRRSVIRAAESGAVVAAALADWIFTEGGTAARRVPAEFIRVFPAAAQTIGPRPLPDVDPPAGAAWSPLRLRAGDLDAMGHGNHTVYFDLLDDAVWRAGANLPFEHPRSYDIQYHLAADAATPLRDLAWRDGGAWRYRLEGVAGPLYVHGRLAAAEPALDVDDLGIDG